MAMHASDQQIMQLYRYYDTDGRLLYVGMSLNVLNRNVAHGSPLPWVIEVVRIEIDHYSSRDEAIRAEKAAIRREHPKYNTAHQLKSVIPDVKHTDVPSMSMASVLDKVSSLMAVAADEGSFTINSWCKHHGISRAFFYKIQSQGNAPDTYKIGSTVRISKEANNAWVGARAHRQIVSGKVGV